jgi:hypothetical protein
MADREKFFQALDSREASVLYRASSFMLLLLISVLVWIGTNTIGDIKELTSAVRDLTSAVRVTDSIVSDHKRRLEALEQWRYNRP